MSRKVKAGRVLERLSRERPGLFARWPIGIRGSFGLMGSPERREPHARIHERPAVRVSAGLLAKAARICEGKPNGRAAMTSSVSAF